MNIAYIAHAVHAALLLDEEGFCRRVVPRPDADATSLKAAHRSVGAQFVASLDPLVEGYLHHEPRVGAALLFTAIKDGRSALVRFGPLVLFDRLPSSVAIESDEAAEKLVASSRRESLVPTVKAPSNIPAAAPSDASITGVFSRNEDPDEALIRVIAGLAAELAPVSAQQPSASALDNERGGIASPARATAPLAETSENPEEDDEMRPSGVAPKSEGGSDETCQFSYAVMGNPTQRADSAWPQPLPRRIG